MKYNHPLVSIIIPTFNRDKCIRNAIKSAVEQSYPNTEIIVVDDGSTDDTRSVVETFPQVKYLYKPNGGQASARNVGLQHANGIFVASLDSDDRWEPNFLEECVQMLEENNLDFVFTNWFQQCEDGKFRDYFSIYREVHPTMPFSKNDWTILSYNKLRDIYTTGCPSPSSSLVLRSSLLTTGWSEEIVIGDDWLMLLEIIFSNTLKVAFTTKCLWHKHIGHNNLVDGRDKQEVFKILWVNDMQRILTHIKMHLHPQELKNLEKLYIKGLLVSAHFSLRRDLNYIESIDYFRKAVIKSPLYTIQIFFKLLYKTISKKLSPLLNPVRLSEISETR